MAPGPVPDLQGDAGRGRPGRRAADPVPPVGAQDPATVAALPPTFPEALTHILEHPNVTLLPFIPEGVAIIPPIQQGLQELITTERPVAEIMAEMGAGIEAIMTARRRLPQAVPGVLADRTAHHRGHVTRDDRYAADRPPLAGGGLLSLPSAHESRQLVRRAVLPPGRLVAGAGRDAGRHGDPVRHHHRPGVHQLRPGAVRRLAVRRPGQLPGAGADRQTPIIIVNTVYLVVATTVIPTVLGLGLAVLMERSIRGIGIIRTLYLRAHHDRADRGRPDVARDVQQRRGLDQLLPGHGRACRRRSGWATRCWPCPWSSSRTAGPACPSRSILLLAALLDRARGAQGGRRGRRRQHARGPSGTSRCPGSGRSCSWSWCCASWTRSASSRASSS